MFKSFYLIPKYREYISPLLSSTQIPSLFHFSGKSNISRRIFASFHYQLTIYHSLLYYISNTMSEDYLPPYIPLLRLELYGLSQAEDSVPYE